jgi:hypothetical protein
MRKDLSTATLTKFSEVLADLPAPANPKTPANPYTTPFTKLGRPPSGALHSSKRPASCPLPTGAHKSLKKFKTLSPAAAFRLPGTPATALPGRVTFQLTDANSNASVNYLNTMSVERPQKVRNEVIYACAFV